MRDDDEAECCQVNWTTNEYANRRISIWPINARYSAMPGVSPAWARGDGRGQVPEAM
jgi:hypothetical protein